VLVVIFVVMSIVVSVAALVATFAIVSIVAVTLDTTFATIVSHHTEGDGERKGRYWGWKGRHMRGRHRGQRRVMPMGDSQSKVGGTEAARATERAAKWVAERTARRIAERVAERAERVAERAARTTKRKLEGDGEDNGDCMHGVYEIVPGLDKENMAVSARVVKPEMSKVLLLHGEFELAQLCSLLTHE
jgi:hypothetical protein